MDKSFFEREKIKKIKRKIIKNELLLPKQKEFIYDFFFSSKNDIDCILSNIDVTYQEYKNWYDNEDFTFLIRNVFEDMIKEIYEHTKEGLT